MRKKQQKKNTVNEKNIRIMLRGVGSMFLLVPLWLLIANPSKITSDILIPLGVIDTNLAFNLIIGLSLFVASILQGYADKISGKKLSSSVIKWLFISSSMYAAFFYLNILLYWN